jgi:hypothetical protein
MSCMRFGCPYYEEWLGGCIRQLNDNPPRKIYNCPKDFYNDSMEDEE